MAGAPDKEGKGAAGGVVEAGGGLVQTQGRGQGGLWRFNAATAQIKGGWERVGDHWRGPVQTTALCDVVIASQASKHLDCDHMTVGGGL